jgi:predicted dehydrogenase
VNVKPVRWGILGTANIAVSKVIPAMQRGERCDVLAIASRDLDRGRAAAAALGIPCAFGSYDELLADPEIEAVYIPLPNHLHVPWSIRAAEAGKHVLCEKPIALSATEVGDLVIARDKAGVLMGEAFMVRTHPQWLAVRELIAEGRIGDLRLVTCTFSYFKRDANNIRNRDDYGGGGLMDIGCYAVNLSRWLFDEEPMEVIADVELDPDLRIDRLTSGMMRFPGGQATFTCATQLVPHQRMQIFGTTGRIEVEIPFNAPPDRATRIFVDDGRDVFGGGVESIELPVVDQYTLQADRFSEAIRGMHSIPVPLEDAIANMAVIDALFRSAETRCWQRPAEALG